MRDDDEAVGHHGVIAGIGAIPFQHREFGQMQFTALAVAKHPRQLEDPALAGRQQFLAGKFRRGSQVPCHAFAALAQQFGARRMQMGLITR